MKGRYEHILFLLIMSLIIISFPVFSIVAKNVKNTASWWGFPIETYYGTPTLGYRIISGLKSTGQGWYTFTSRKALVEYIIKAGNLNETETYAFTIYCTIPNKIHLDLNLGLAENEIAEAMYYEDGSSLQRALEIIKASFPEELKAYISIGPFKGYIYVFKVKPGEVIRIPITIEAPLGKLSREYVILFIMIGDASEEGFSGVELALYLGP